MSTQSDFLSTISSRIMNGYSTHTSGTQTTSGNVTRRSRGAWTASPRVSSTDSFAISSVVLPQNVIDNYERDVRQEEEQQQQLNGRSNNNNNANAASGMNTRINFEGDSEFESNMSQSELMDLNKLNNNNTTGAANTPWSFAERETRQILWLKGITILIFLLASLLVSLAIFYSTKSNYEQATFETIYKSQANQIAASVQSNLWDLVLGLDTWAVRYYEDDSDDDDNNNNTNSLTIQDVTFPLQAQQLLQSSHASWIAMAPLIASNDTSVWEENGKDHYESWLDAAPGPVRPEKGGGDDEIPYYFPLWQHEPLLEGLVNVDMLSVQSDVAFELSLAALRTPPTMVLGTYLEDGVFPKESNDNDVIRTIGPTSILYLPFVVPSTISSTTTATTSNDDNVTGVVMGWMDWIRYIQTPLLEPTADGIVVVLKNTCGDPEGTEHVFQVERSSSTMEDERKDNAAILLPLDELPENILSNTAITMDITKELANAITFQQQISSGSGGGGLVTDLYLSEQYCPHQMVIYATETVQNLYVTSLPAIYLSSIILVFFFCAAIFLLYDCLVERRQRMVMKTAIKSHEIVANLFPEVVRNRLFGDAASEELLDLEGGGDHTNTMREGDDEAGDVAEYLNKPSMMNFAPATGKKTKPIADLFLHTTVLFADIAGFTAWSSVRDPSQVFTLLETVYAAFDKLALSRRVFKVETIGDCYVAVTGLPNPQENHAVLMVKFARDCLGMMQHLTQSLEVELGPDTGDLAIRIGMHSGPVTAGVLRGQKSRFQLFGDTVNFASRMESNGFPNQIQCSQQTADLLVNAGKQNWIHARKDMVHAKGKGHVQTYWIIATRAVSSAGSSRSLGYDDDDDSDITDEPLNDLGESIANLSAGDLPYSKSYDRGQLEQSPMTTTNTVGSSGDYNSPAGGATTSNGGGDGGPQLSRRADVSPHMQRLIKWNVDTLSKAIKKIVATRSAREKQLQIASELRLQQGTNHSGSAESNHNNNNNNISTRLSSMTAATHDTTAAVKSDDHHHRHHPEDAKEEAAAAMNNKAPKLVVLTNPRSEYTEAIALPKFDPFKVVRRSAELAAEVHLSPNVMQQLNDFVTTIACAYNDNPFHNFEHASHVTMSAGKILKRVVNAEHLKIRKASLNNLASKMHDFTYGITSDPLTHFACLFSAMIHDVDHPGVSNMQLLKEKHEMAELYDGLSIAEQNSFDFAWELLMDAEFEELRSTVFTTEEELRRFRQLVINSIMATDVFDPDLVKIRNERWLKAFPKEGGDSGGANGHTTTTDGEEKRDLGDSTTYIEDTTDLKATIVIEHIIQAADVAHTMQHWHVYQKWNRRLFEEMYEAYKSGRSANNPAASWYKGELWFYDNYIIPLAKKLDECQVFGASSDEFLTYALDNRNEWETKGETIVEELVESCSHQSEQFQLQELNRRGSLMVEKDQQ